MYHRFLSLSIRLIHKTIRKSTIDSKFDFDKTIVKPQYREEMKKFTDVMKSYYASTG